jgi:predicted amidohydrolase
MRLIGVQLDIVWEDKAATFERVRRLLDAGQPPAGSLVVLPEMFATGFSMNVAAIREGGERPAERFLESVAREYGVHVLGGVVNSDADAKGRNQALVFGPDGRELCRYDKIHPFNLGEEGEHYAGGSAVRCFDWGGMTVAPLVCYDLRFPETFREAVATRQGRRAAQLFAVIANWPSRRDGHWVTLLQARAIENQAYVIGVNRCGSDPKHAYSGRSLIVDPHGKVLADAGSDECLISAEVDVAAVESWRREFPALADMEDAVRRRAR